MKKILLRLSPALIPFILFFVGGIVITFFQSVGLFTPLGSGEISLAAYHKILAESHFLKSIIFSFNISLVSATISIIFGCILAYKIWMLPDKLRNLSFIYKIPVILPHIAVAFITIILFSKTGIVSSIAFKLGLISDINEFPNIIYSSNGFGEIIAYIFKETSFVILMLISVLMKIDKRYIQTARLLGASEFRTFWKVILPQLKSIITTTFLILFIYSFGAFEIPYLLGSSTPGMLSIQVFDYYFRHDLVERPVAMALLVIMFIFSGLFSSFYFYFANRAKK